MDGTKDRTDMWVQKTEQIRGHGEGKEGGMNCESSVDIYTLTARRKLLCSAVSPAGCPVMTCRGGKEARGGGYVCTHAGDSLYCTAETNNIIKQLYSNLKKFHHVHYNKPFSHC